MSKNKPVTMSLDAIKHKARTSAAALSSLILSGHRSTIFSADVERIKYHIGVNLIAQSVVADGRAAAKVNIGYNAQTALTVAKFDIENEIKEILKR